MPHPGRPEDEDAALLTGQHQLEHPDAEPQGIRRWQGVLALAGIPLLLLCFLPLSAILHPLAHSFYPVEEASTTTAPKEFEWTPGEDPYLEAHPSALRAAEAAKLGPWANQDTTNKSPAKAYTPVGKLKNNGTHDFEKTVLMISLDGVRSGLVQVLFSCL